MHLLSVVSALILLASTTVAHPGHDISLEVAERRDFLNIVKRTDLSHCAAKLKARGVEKRNVARRRSVLEEARSKRALKKRDLATVLATSHNETTLGYTADTDVSTLFTGNNSCLLSPEVTQGPYYVGGEYIRQSLVEEQTGVDIILDYQVIDIATCDPVPNVYLEMWHCNSTGVYSGIVANSNGQSSDTANINSTFLRGIQKTDADGVAQFESLFPGHYTSRANHVHILIHQNATVYANGTLGNDVQSSHVGQAFFDQNLISAVEVLEPYASNTQELTLNTDDSILAQEVATEGVDPIFEYTLLGASVSDGLFGWLAFGINTTQSSSVTPAAFRYAEGGVENSNSGGGGQGGGPGGNSTGGGNFGSSGPGSNSTGTPQPITTTSGASSPEASSVDDDTCESDD